MAFKLIMIYGPPAVGKLTVAQELGEITGYKLLHNHMLADIYGPIFGYGTEIGARLNVTFRGEIYEAAAKSGLSGLISTFFYYGEKHHGFIKELINRVVSNNGEVCFVRLFCSKKKLLERVVMASRKKFHKIASVEKLNEVLGKHDINATLPQTMTKTLEINTNRLSPKEAALIIAKRFVL